jgi:hypothetical protein
MTQYSEQADKIAMLQRERLEFDDITYALDGAVAKLR